MAEKGKKLNDLAYKKDSAGNVIQSGQSIVDILEVAVTSGTWTAVQLGGADQMACKSALAAMRDGTNYKISHLSNGARYKTIRGSFSLDIAKERGAVLFYVQSIAASGTLEVVLLD